MMSPFADRMRNLWADHVDRTRDYLLAEPARAPAALATLLQNQDDIGRLFGVAYGPAAEHAVASLLREHIQIAGAIIAALRAGASPSAPLAAWYANADQISGAIHRLNPTFLSKPKLMAMMRRHLDLTKEEVVSEIQGRRDYSLAMYQAAKNATVMMASDLSTAIETQIPHLSSQSVGLGYPTSTCPPGQSHAYGAGGENGADPGCEKSNGVDQLACGDHAAFSHLQCSCEAGYSPRSDGGRGCEYTGGVTGGANIAYTPPPNGGSGPGGTPTAADYNVDTTGNGDGGAASNPNQKPFPWIPILLITAAVGAAYGLSRMGAKKTPHAARYAR